MSGEEIHFIFDKTVCPSIKDIERTSRERNDTLTYRITGPFQKRPTDWLKAMKIDSFKKSLVQYLTESWKNHDLATYLGNKTLYANCENKVYAYKVKDSKLIVTEEDRLYSDHEEADSRMIFHVKEIAASDELKDIVIHAIDTDVLIIALGCYEELEEKNLWMEAILFDTLTLKDDTVHLDQKIFKKLWEILFQYKNVMM